MSDSPNPRTGVSPIDLARIELDYEGFRALALDHDLSLNERIGFPDSYREGFEEAIFQDILLKLPAVAHEQGLTFLDVGPGCSILPRRFIELCRNRKHRIVLIDSPEMLEQLPDIPGTTHKVPGCFPNNHSAVAEAIGANGANAILCYSVLHYMYVDCNLFDVIDSVMSLLAPEGRALIGDIPNQSKRRRFFASETGRRYHRAFTGTDALPLIDFNSPVPGKIDDAVLAGLIARAQLGGCDAYLLPQGAALPMANRRDDLLIARP